MRSSELVKSERSRDLGIWREQTVWQRLLVAGGLCRLGGFEDTLKTNCRRGRIEYRKIRLTQNTLFYTRKIDSMDMQTSEEKYGMFRCCNPCTVK